MVSRKPYLAGLREWVVQMIFELRAETGIRVVDCRAVSCGWGPAPIRQRSALTNCKCCRLRLAVRVGLAAQGHPSVLVALVKLFGQASNARI